MWIVKYYYYYVLYGVTILGFPFSNYFILIEYIIYYIITVQFLKIAQIMSLQFYRLTML